MLIIAIGWLFVVLVFALAQVTAPGGSALGALLTLVLGTAPLAVVLYIGAMVARRRAASRRSGPDPDRGGHASGDAVAPVREEP